MLKNCRKSFIILGLVVFTSIYSWSGEKKGQIGKPAFDNTLPDTVKFHSQASMFKAGEPVIPTADEIKLLNLINAARQDPASVDWGSYPAVPRLEPNINLWLAARFHSQEMVDSGYFEHDSYDSYGNVYETWGKRITERFGYAPEGPMRENIAKYSTVETAFNEWLKSTGHRDNIFSNDVTETGIGIINYLIGPNTNKMFTHDFGYRAIEFDLMLSASDISISPSDAGVGDILRVSATVHNLKRTHAFPVEVCLFDGNPGSGGKLICRDTIPSIVGENSSAKITLSWNTISASAGTHNIWVKIDSSNHFAETNENNNSAYKSVYLEKISLLPEKQVYSAPNPARNKNNVTLYFQLNVKTEAELPSDVKIEIYDVAGDIVKIIELSKTQGDFHSGINTYPWDIKSVPRGLYLYKVIAGNEQVISKIAIIK